MSFFGLFGNKAPRTAETLPEYSGLDNGGNNQLTSPGSGRKSMRLGQRELLYGAVRDVMIRAGVLVASYNFKVLSLDAQGRQYLIMMDLLNVDMWDMKRLGEIDSMIVQAAKMRHDLVVTGVYWRNELQKPNIKTLQTPSPDADVSDSVSRDNRAAPTSRNIQRDETNPFKQAVTRVDAEKSDKGVVGSTKKQQRSSSPEFEDTRIILPTERRSQLSATQYGDLE